MATSHGLPELDKAYLPGISIAPRPYLDGYAKRSALARRMLPWREFSYGRSGSERLHFFPATAPEAPLLVFVHGGYWQELTEAESSFAAASAVAHGVAFGALGYGFAPPHRLDEIVAMVRRGGERRHHALGGRESRRDLRPLGVRRGVRQHGG